MESVAKAAPLDSSQACKELTMRVWQHWPGLLLSLVVLMLYLPVLTGLVRQWSADASYSHGFFVPVFTGYLIWRKRGDLARLPVRPSAAGTVCVLLSLGLLFLGSLGAEYFLQRISLWGMIIGLLFYFLGWPRLRVIMFPIAFLLFMIPLPAIIYNEVVFPLQLVASHLTGNFLQAINVPVSREGNLLVLPNYTLEVVDACSGIRSLISLLTLAFGYGYLVERSLVIRVVLGFAMVPLAIVSNAVRLVIIVLLVYYGGSIAADGFLHSLSSFAVFLTAALLLLIVHGVLASLKRKLRPEANH